jgi:aryl-phospho-beta-D-glucosidase BglC (GH1 family)
MKIQHLKLSWAQACWRSLIGKRKNINKLKCSIAAIACLALPSVGSATQVMPCPGFNLGNTLESTWGYTAPTKALIDSIHNAGFKTLRVPCAWDFNSTGGTINSAYMTQVANVVNWAIADGMYVIINDHWDNGWFERDSFNTYSSTLNTKLINIWTQVANQFKNTDVNKLAFSCSNEPGAANQTQVNVLYQYYQNWINAMRANGGNNASRWLLINAPCVWNWDIVLSYGTTMPNDSAHKLMLETHTYDPGEFTVNTTDSPIPMTYFWGSAYHVTGSMASRNANTATEESYIQSQLTKLQNAFINKGFPVLIGEWAGQPKPAESDLTGQYINQNVASVSYYNKFMENTMNSYGFSATFFTGQGDMFDTVTGNINNQTKLNGVLGVSCLAPVAGLNGGGGGGPVANGTYKIIARHSGKGMDAYNQLTANGTQIQQWTYWGGAGQKWTVTDTGSGVYKIIGVQSGRSLDIYNFGTANGTKVELWDYNNGSAQQFKFAATSSGYYRITPNCATGSCLDVNGVSTADGALVQLWTYGGGNNQQWIFQAP